jgi:DHA2 family multidrug resistance protein-like MFS transporter
VAAIALGLLLGLVFARRQRRLADPLIDLRLFRAPAFSVALAANSLSLLTAFGISLFVAQYLQLVLGLSPLVAGLWTIPSSAGFIAGSMLAPLAVRRHRPAVAMSFGLALAALGFALLTQVGQLGELPLLVAGHFTLALGIAPVVTLGTDIIVGAAPPERAGAASAISETGAELGGALGIAILGSIGTAVYRGAMTRALPSTAAPEAMEAARSTLGAAVAMAEALPDQAGTVLLATAREAFTESFQVSAIVGVVISIALAILVAVMLRQPRATLEARREAA